ARSEVAGGASGVGGASGRALKDHDLSRRPRTPHLPVRADDPIYMLSAPTPATRLALDKAGLKISDISAIEINEAFASVVLAWLKELGADPARVNPNGGAIALGHPIGATGTRLMATLPHELERSGRRARPPTMCERRAH